MTAAASAQVAPRSRGWRGALRRAPWFRRTKLFLKRLVGREPTLALDAVVPLERYGDWALVSGSIGRGSVVYAAGIGRDLGLERELATHCGAEVHAFDPSPESLRWVSMQPPVEGLSVHALGLAERDGRLQLHAHPTADGTAPLMYSAVDDTRRGPKVEVDAFSLGSLMRRLGHRELALLKLDIEGAEFGVIDGMLDDGVLPMQIMAEFHHRFPTLGKQFAERAVARLRAAGYRLVYLSDNGREFTFLKSG